LLKEGRRRSRGGGGMPGVSRNRLVEYMGVMRVE